MDEEARKEKEFYNELKLRIQKLKKAWLMEEFEKDKKLDEEDDTDPPK